MKVHESTNNNIIDLFTVKSCETSKYFLCKFEYLALCTECCVNLFTTVYQRSCNELVFFSFEDLCKKSLPTWTWLFHILKNTKVFSWESQIWCKKNAWCYRKPLSYLYFHLAKFYILLMKWLL